MRRWILAAICCGYLVTPLARTAGIRTIPQQTTDLDLPARPDSPAHKVRITIWRPRDGVTPIVFYEPGWAEARTDNDAILNRLAGQGYTLVSIDESPAQPDDAGRLLRTLQAPMDFSSAAASAATVARADQMARLFATDASQVLDRLPSLGVPLDPQRIGIFGFSFGGAVAAQTCWRDSRFQGAANLDGWLFADASAHWINQPYLLVGADDSNNPSPPDSFDAQEEKRARAHFASRGGTLVMLDGPAHSDFTTGGAPRVQALAGSFIESFFRQVFAGSRSPQFADLAKQFPEAKVQTWPPQPP